MNFTRGWGIIFSLFGTGWGKGAHKVGIHLIKTCKVHGNKIYMFYFAKKTKELNQTI